MSELRTNRIIPRDGLPSGSAGGIIQVKSVLKLRHIFKTIKLDSGTLMHDIQDCLLQLHLQDLIVKY